MDRLQVASAALDVYSSEPPPESSRELLQHPRLVCTPHLGASTEEAQVRRDNGGGGCIVLVLESRSVGVLFRPRVACIYIYLVYY